MAQKKTKVIEHIDFPEKYKVIGADLSLRRPGWCVLTVNKGQIENVKLYSLDNKSKKNKTHNEILREIASLFGYIEAKASSEGIVCYLVREKMIMNMKVPSERDVAKVVGIMDYLADNWYEIYPVTVKLQIAGSGKADKQQVAESLEKYIGRQDYKCDDESDAAAVAVAWLIQHEQMEDKNG